MIFESAGKSEALPAGCLLGLEPVVCDGCFDAGKDPKIKAAIKEK